jgi:hypothetical protein
MVVPGHDPGRSQVRRLQVAVAFVLRIARAVLRQRERFVAAGRPVRMAQPVGPPLVDVVAEEGNQVGCGSGDMAVRRVVAEFPVLAGGDGELQFRRQRIACRRRARSPDRTDGIAQHEAVPVPAVRPQAGRLDMDAVREFGSGHGTALRDDFTEALVLGHFPAHRECQRRHRCRIERIGQDAGPEDD